MVSGAHIARLSTLLAAAVILTTASAAYCGTALWVVNRSGAFVAEFAGKGLKKSGETSPNRVLASANLNSPWGLIFDSANNLWVSNVGNGTLTEFTLSQLKHLKSNNAPAAAVVLHGLNRPEGMAFDKQGNLWVANEGLGTLLKFTPSQLTASGTPTPAVIITSPSVSSPVGITFDSGGNLWVGDDSFSEVEKFTKAQLAASGSPVASVILSDDGSTSLVDCEPVLFDRFGDLWVGNEGDGSVVQFTLGQLAASGNPTPAVKLSATTVNGTAAPSLDAPAALAFDSSGNLWVGNIDSDHDGSVAKFSRSTIKANGSPQPSVFINSDAPGTNLDQPYFLTFGPKVP